MSQNWMRHFELKLLDRDDEEIQLNDFKVTFRIDWRDDSSPVVADVKIWNLSDNLCNRLMKKEYSQMTIVAGYDGGGENEEDHNYGTLFSGEIRFAVKGRDDLKDTWIQLQAAGNYSAWIDMTTETTLAGGHTVADINRLMMRDFNTRGITQGVTGAMPEVVYPRGRVMMRPAREQMDLVAEMCAATWQMVEGQLRMVPVDNYIDNVVELNGGSGLVGMPQLTLNGQVNVKCLINPDIQLNSLIKLTENQVYSPLPASMKLDGKLPEKTQPGPESSKPGIDGLGEYIVRAITYKGDTRGSDWYMEMTCEAKGDKQPLGWSSQ